jgi:RNA polymerase sigma-70 factor, ECF subfamily
MPARTRSLQQKFSPKTVRKNLNGGPGRPVLAGECGLTLSPDQNAPCFPLDGFVTESRDGALDSEFSALVRRHARFVYRVAYAVVRNAYDAEDVAQEMFFKLYRSGRWTTIIDDKAFLARSTWRIAVDHRAKRVRSGESMPAPETDENRNPETQALESAGIRRVHALIDALPEDLRVPLALSTLEELKSNEIGRILGIPEGTVRSRIARARQLLREKLGNEKGGTLGPGR